MPYRYSTIFAGLNIARKFNSAHVIMRSGALIDKRSAKERRVWPCDTTVYSISCSKLYRLVKYSVMPVTLHNCLPDSY